MFNLVTRTSLLIFLQFQDFKLSFLKLVTHFHVHNYVSPQHIYNHQGKIRQFFFSSKNRTPKSYDSLVVQSINSKSTALKSSKDHLSQDINSTFLFQSVPELWHLWLSSGTLLLKLVNQLWRRITSNCCRKIQVNSVIQIRNYRCAKSPKGTQGNQRKYMDCNNVKAKIFTELVSMYKNMYL